MKTSIIDVPKNHQEQDLLGIDKYQLALVEFMKNTDTPLTIALQGEWGSGKTSLMNTLQFALCQQPNALFNAIWINTWQYSLLRSPQQAILKILEGIIQQIVQIHADDKLWEERKKKFVKILGKITTSVAKSAINTASAGIIDGGFMDGLFESDASVGAEISELKNEIATLINDCLSKDKTKQGFIFFIDDLDRIDPPIAVQILELLKNIFDLNKCLFVLAIDYDVVVKGLKPKFGELTQANEREFRSFFDKIIQLPFSMPVAAYNIDRFLIEALVQIGFLNKEEIANEKIIHTLSEFTQLSVGTNPRSLKRLINILSLIRLINSAESQDIERYEKLVNFGLVCIQIAYPYIYNHLCKEPDFKQWDMHLAQKIKLRPLQPEEIESLNATEEFDEEWEKVLFRMCQKELFLSNRVFQVSQLLNEIAKVVPEEYELGYIIGNIIELSSVTNIDAVDKPKIVLHKSSFLKRIHEQLLPELQRRLKKPYKHVEQQGSRVVTNLWYKFDKKNWINWICVTAVLKEGKLCLTIWKDYLLCEAKAQDIKDDLARLGKLEAYREVEAGFLQLCKKYPMAVFRESFFKKKGQHQLHHSFSFIYDTEEECLKTENITFLADFITDFMQSYIPIKQIIGLRF